VRLIGRRAPRPPRHTPEDDVRVRLLDAGMAGIEVDVNVIDRAAADRPGACVDVELTETERRSGSLTRELTFW
jgi:hypothetical protein